MKYGCKNKLKVNPLAYNLMLIGESGIGKTTVIKEYCDRLAPDKYIFLECGKEDGADAIDGINYINCPEWDMNYDKNTNSVGFATFIDDVVENRTTEWSDLKVVVVDTYDELFAIAEPEVIRMHNRQNPDKRVDSIKAAFGGFQGGEDKTLEIVLDKLWELKHMGICFILIGHTKTRNMTDPVTGQEYLQLTTNLPQKYFNGIKTKVHILGVASIDREIVKEKTGKKDFVTKKDIEKGVVTNQTRKITFRDDNYVIDSKSRFADIVPEIPLNADALVNAITNAITAEMNKSNTNKSFDEIKKEQEAAEAENLLKLAEKEKINKENKEIEGLKSKIVEYVTENKTNMAVVKPILEKCAEYGYKNPMQIMDLEAMKAVAAMIEQ